MVLEIGKYYRDMYNRKLQYIGKNGIFYEFIYSNSPFKPQIRINGVVNNQFMNSLRPIEDEAEGYTTDSEYPDDFDGGRRKQKTKRRRNKRRRTIRKKRSRK